MKIGNKLKKLREFHNYTQEYVAGCVDISTSQYCKYEKEGTPITIDMIGRIAAVYKIAPLELLGWDEKSAFDLHKENEIPQRMQSPKIQKDNYLAILIRQLQDENSFLKDENNRLWTIIDRLKK